MNLSENIKEGVRSIKGEMLRTVITALIISLGIMALVGMLTTVDGIQSSVNSSFADLGANTFDILIPNEYNQRRGGKRPEPHPPISYHQALKFKQKFEDKGIVSVSMQGSGIVQAKYESKQTNPNTQIVGIDESYINIKAYKIALGRNITSADNAYISRVVILGNDVAKNLFPDVSPLGKEVGLMGDKFTVVGVLEKKESSGDGGQDRIALVPLEMGRVMAANQQLTFDITASVTKITDIDEAIGEATSTMRQIRGDEVGENNSFEIERADAFVKDMEEISGYLRAAGFGFGFITLLGAAIALMNMMMVSVTERTREIGIRKSLGATPTKIRLQFLIEAIIICILGGIGGIVLGILIGNVLSNLISENASFIIPWAWMFLGLSVCVTVGIISGFYPAYKASKLDPIESLRYE